ncbi:MAG: GNAT family N-acetyltransferase [Rhodospirillales bacterium]|nr:GNAT family N-acetyltransferase [Rhodospirillales bacterium]
MSADEIIIRLAEMSELEAVKEAAHSNYAARDADYWAQCLSRMELDELTVCLALTAGHEIAGYALLNWSPKYRVYQQLDIPEIQDLNVLPAFRRQGIATSLIKMCEALSLEAGKTQIGISFGLTRSFGPAQRLYISLGYIPDGFGVTYDRDSVPDGQLRPVDDELCLMLIKDLPA